MNTPRQIAANRANARVSTGPQTVAGKRRASGNARRHGLSIPVASDPILSIEIAQLARRLVGDIDDAEITGPARAFAEAEVDLGRVKRARLELMRHLFAIRAEGADPAAHQAVARQLARLDRYERRIRARRKRIAGAFTDRFIDAVARQGLAALDSAST